jgi:hypothetical protein
MFIELNEEQANFALGKDLMFRYCIRIKKGSHIDTYEAYNNFGLTQEDVDAVEREDGVIYVYVDDYEELPAEMRNLSSPEPNAQQSIMKKDYSPPGPTNPSGPSVEKMPDYQALALLLIDLYEEKQDVDARIAAVKTKLNK